MPLDDDRGGTRPELADVAAVDRLAATELRPDLQDALARLDPDQRHAVLLRDVVGASYVEIAQAQEVRRSRGEEYRVVPVLRPGLTPAVLGFWVPDEEPGAVVVRAGPTAMNQAMPAVPAALVRAR